VYHLTRVARSRPIDDVDHGPDAAGPKDHSPSGERLKMALTELRRKLSAFGGSGIYVKLLTQVSATK
jgi:hypothetical protein